MLSSYSSEQINAIIELKKDGVPHRDIAEMVLGGRTKASSVFYILEKHYYNTANVVEEKKHPKMLFLDIETSPEMVYTFSRFKTNISPGAVVKDSRLLTFAGRWADGDKDVYGHNRGYIETAGVRVRDLDKTLDRFELEPLLEVWNALDKADIVVAHNGNRFDIPYLNTRFAKHGLHLPSPFRKVDTFRLAKRVFRFNANSLAELARFFNLGGKDKMVFEDWVDYLNGSPDAADKMLRYNIQDVELLQQVYLKLVSYDNQHPNINLYTEENDDFIRCPICGSSHIEKAGFVTTAVSKFEAYRCKDCGHTFRSNKKVQSVTARGIA